MKRFSDCNLNTMKNELNKQILGRCMGAYVMSFKSVILSVYPRIRHSHEK